MIEDEKKKKLSSLSLSPLSLSLSLSLSISLSFSLLQLIKMMSGQPVKEVPELSDAEREANDKAQREKEVAEQNGI
jgi:hypothetical protein